MTRLVGSSHKVLYWASLRDLKWNVKLSVELNLKLGFALMRGAYATAGLAGKFYV